MPIVRRERGADSPLVERIAHVAFDGAGGGVTTPDGCWDLVVMRRRGQVSVLQTGVITRPVELGYEPGDEYVCISFKPGVFMPSLPGELMVDRGLMRPTVNKRSFHFDGDTLEIPSFDNAEVLVNRWARRSVLLRDEIVAGIADGNPRASSPRSVQRHFQHAMGVTAKRFSQIVRARRAVDLLGGGRAPAAIAQELGFADQAHLTRALKALMGCTPGEIVRAARP
jgi:hypothetical protein